MSHYPIKFPTAVRRIHVAWRKGKWSIEGETRVESMTLPKSYELPAGEPSVSGFWYEGVDNQGRTIYRQLVTDPFSASLEVFNEDGTITRKPHRMPEEVLFDVLVPDVPQITAVHFYGTMGGEHEQKPGPAKRVGEVELRPHKGGSHGRR